jgi:hypothetical protein
MSDRRLVFCEPVAASSISPWCLRYVEGESRLSGGVTTDSLCGRVKAPMGWDVDVPVDTWQLTGGRACRRCVDALRAIEDGRKP